jgi:hypothetical protein
VIRFFVHYHQFEAWKDNVLKAHALKQRMVVFFFPKQVGAGKIAWDECAEHARLRDKVMADWPKDEAGWPKQMSAEEEAEYREVLPERERVCIEGLGGSQKAEVAWLDKQGIPYDELDVGDFGRTFLNRLSTNQEEETGPIDNMEGALSRVMSMKKTKSYNHQQAIDGLMRRQGGLDKGTSFSIDKKQLSLAQQRSARTETIGDGDDEDLREVRGMSIDIESVPVRHSSPGPAQEQLQPVNPTRRKGGTKGKGKMGGKTESVMSAVDPSTGKTYYYNQYTQKTGWEAEGLSRGATDREYGIDREDEGDGIAELEPMSNPLFGGGDGARGARKKALARTTRTLTPTESKQRIV